MKKREQWLLVAGLAVGSLVSCSRASTKSPGGSNSMRKSIDPSGRELVQGGSETDPEAIKDKPSPCIKWAKGVGPTSKRQRKAIKTAAGPKAVPEDPEKKLQAENESHQQ